MVRFMDNDARHTARCYYASSTRNLQADLAALGGNAAGVVVWTPQLVAMLKPVAAGRAAEWEELAESPADADAWYVHLLAGDLELARRLGAGLAALPLLCFRRGLRNATPHIHRWQSFVHPQP